MNPVFYSSIDRITVSRIETFVRERRRRDKLLPLEFIYVVISGDAGTGKTRMMNYLRYSRCIRPLFAGATHVAGNVLNATFKAQQYYVNDHSVYPTTFQQMFRINPKKWNACVTHIFKDASNDVLNGTSKTPEEFYGAIRVKLGEVCDRLIENRYESHPNTVTPDDYWRIRNSISSSSRSRSRSVREIHAATMKMIKSEWYAKDVFDHLDYDAFVFDEAGRLSFSWTLINVGMFYKIHEYFGTGVDNPVVVAVGSCTQSGVINDSCIEGCVDKCSFNSHRRVPLNDLSMLTGLIRGCLTYPDSVFVKHAKHNRRLKNGDLEKAAYLGEMNRSLEMGKPVDASVWAFIRDKMSVSKEDFFSKKAIHLCSTHEECRAVSRADVVVDPSEIIDAEECLTARGVEWPDLLLDCSVPAGSMFKSANYASREWRRTTANLPASVGSRFIFKIKTDDEGEPVVEAEKFSCWKATRRFFTGRPYSTTHAARGYLTEITGTWKEFLEDLDAYEYLYEKNPILVVEFIKALSTSMTYAFHADEGVLERIEELSSGGVGDDSIHSLRDLRNYVGTFIVDGRSDTVLYSRPIDSYPPVSVPKGVTGYIVGSSRRRSPVSSAPIRVRFGKTLIVSIYRSAISIGKSVESFIADSIGGGGDDNNDKFRKYRRKKNTDDVVMEVDVDPSLEFQDDERIEDEWEKRNNDDGNDYNEEDEAMVDDERRRRPPPPPMKMSTIERSAVFNFNDEKDFATSEDHVVKGGGDKRGTALDIYPLKISLVSTIAASQGMTIETEVYGMVNKNMKAADMIVMSSRSNSADNQFFYFTHDADNTTISPLDDITREAVKKIVVLSMLNDGPM